MDGRLASDDRAGQPGSPPGGMRAARTSILHLENLGDELRVYWRDGHSSEFLALWLRDNAPRPGPSGSPHPGRPDPGLLPDTLSIREARTDGRGDLLLRFDPEPITLRFPAPWLRHHGDAGGSGPAADPREAWDAGLEEHLPRLNHEQLEDDERALGRWLDGVRRLGVGLIRRLPPQPGCMLRVVERFGFARRIEPGTCFAPDERPLGARRIADGDARGLHTAAPWRDPVPALRLLHCLCPAARGGESWLVDGLAAARIVASHHPVYLGLLTRHAVPFERREGNTHLLAHRALVAAEAQRPLAAVHYDPLHTAALDLPAATMRDFYSAYCCLSRTLNRVDLRLHLPLASGDLLLLDNRRVLWGRAAFRGEPVLESCYAEWDGLEARWRRLQAVQA